jgi:hypothetical protein
MPDIAGGRKTPRRPAFKGGRLGIMSFIEQLWDRCMPDEEISDAGRQARFERWEKLGLDAVKQDLATGGHRLIGGPPQVRALAREWVQIKEADAANASEEKTLIETALRLGVPIDDLCTPDGRGIAYSALRDFKAQIGDVLVELQKGDRLQEWHLINQLKAGGCPIASLRSELWQRVMTAQSAKQTMETTPEEKPADLVTLNPNFHGIGINLKEAGRRLRRWRKKS